MRDSGDRGAQFDRALAALRSGTGVFIVGEPGSGRTRLIASLVRELDDETRGRLWHGDPLDSLRIDEAERLARAVIAKRVVPIATTGHRSVLPPPLEALWRDGIVLRVELTPMTPNETLAVIELHLGGPLQTTSVPQFVPLRDGGDLVLLIDAVDAARRDRALVEVDGRWSLVSPMTSKAELRHRMSARLGTESSPSTWLLLDVIGLAPELTLQNLRELVLAVGEHTPGPAGDDEPAGNGRPFTAPSIMVELERLEVDGVVEIVPTDGELTVRIRDPILELILPQTIPFLRSQRIAETVVRILGGLPLTRLLGSELVVLARRSLEVSAENDPTLLVWAARAAVQSSRFDLARDLALVAIEHGGGVDAGLVVAAADVLAGDTESALDRLRELRQSTLLDDYHRQAVVELDEAVRTRTAHSAFRWLFPRSAVQTGHRDLARDIRVDHRIPAGASQGPATLLEVDRHAQAATAALFEGRVSAALAAIEEGERAASALGADTGQLELRRGIVLCVSGRLAEAILRLRILRDRAAVEGNVVQRMMASTLLAECFLMAGRADDSLAESQAAQSIANHAGMPAAAGSIRIDSAIAHSLLGRAGEARSAIETADAHTGSPGGHLDAAAQEAMGWVHAAEGDLDAAVGAFMRSAEIHEVAGHDVYSLQALAEAARAGAAGSVHCRVTSLASGMDGLVYGLTARHVELLAVLQAGRDDAADGDGMLSQGLADDLSRLGLEFSRAGMDLHASEAFSHAAWLQARFDDERGCAGSTRLAEEALARCGLNRSPFVTGSYHLPLSARERQIAGMAATGKSNRDISDELVLSVRTVETHLQRVYRKLGVRARSELAEALPHERREGVRPTPTAID